MQAESAPDMLYALDAEVVFRGKPMRVAGRLRLEDAAGMAVWRYLLSDGAGAPVLVEQSGGKTLLLRPLPPAAAPQSAGNTVTVGAERYLRTGTRKLKVLETLGQVPGVAPGAALLLSGVYEGPAGTLMRELVLRTETQVYFLVKPLAAQELVSAAAHARARDAERRAAGERDEV